MRLPIPYGPNWYAAVMGTGVISLAAHSLPFSVPALDALALLFWLAAAALLVAIGAVGLRHRIEGGRTGQRVRHQHDPVMAHFCGAPPMALLTVGTGAMTVGRPVLGSTLALGVDAVLWTAGTLLGLWVAVAIPYRAITTHDVGDASATGGWLMPVVPPLVSATGGAVLVPYLPAGQPRETMLLVCYAFFGLSVLAALLVLNQLWHRLVRHGVPAPAAVPTVWIVLGFLGQSTTAAQHLGEIAPATVPGYGHALQMLTLCYGVPAWGFTLLWAALATALTVRQLRDGLPFAPTWWSFTFPIGTVVTGTAGLAVATGLDLFKVGAGLAMLALLTGWAAATTGTLRTFLPRRPTGRLAAPEQVGVPVP